MRIAFDVKGTIEGPKKEQVLKMLRLFQEAGHECVVWSNSFGYAVDAVRDNKLDNTVAMHKRLKSEMDGSEHFDFAVEDDTSQTWLAAKKFIFVHEIPDDVDSFVKHLLESP